MITTDLVALSLDEYFDLLMPSQVVHDARCPYHGNFEIGFDSVLFSLPCPKCEASGRRVMLRLEARTGEVGASPIP